MKSVALALAALTLGALLMPADAVEKPLLAVGPFVNSAGETVEPWWVAGGANKTLNAACTELGKSAKFRVAPASTAAAMSAAAHVELTKPLSKLDLLALGKANPSVKYLVLGSLTSYTVSPIESNVAMMATLNATMLNVETGETVWTDEANHHGTVSAPPGGVNMAFYDQMFDKVVRPVVAELAADIEGTDTH